jgi:hypothetical protein
MVPDGASRFFYTAKASVAERNEGLDGCLTVKHNIDKSDLTGEILCQDVSMAAVQLLKKVTSDTAAMSFSIGESGESITVRSPWDFLSITLTEISKIIESRILSLLTRSLIKEFTQVASCEMVNGGNHAENAESLKKYLLTITKGNQALALGASNAALKMLLKTNAKENWRKEKNIHSTVKPIKLMEYLGNLLKTPTGGTFIDPFGGSGTTALAWHSIGCSWILCEKEEQYCKIAAKRIEAAASQKSFEDYL